jgi:hypothetical protein
VQIIEGQALAAKCDYSFGDHALIWDHTLKGNFGYANATNLEFITKAKEFEGRIMTLWIDNLRLYPRPVKTDTENDRKFVEYIMTTNNLLGLCSLLPSNGFIIFTGQEDTPIDRYIEIPWNVVRINAVNALHEHQRVAPIFFGVQRQMNDKDNRIQILKENVERDEHTEPTKLLYINCSIQRNPERDYLPHFQQFDWATCHFDKDSKFFPYDKYQDFLNQIKDHKFMACPLGHGNDCHRNLESLYLRRVPVMKEHKYFRKLYKDFPILYVNDWSEVTKELLEANNHLYQQAQTMDLSLLDLDNLYNRCVKI